MEAYGLDDLESRRAVGGRAYLEFLRSPDLSSGLYVLEAGAVDGQSPHTEDEVYVVMRGKARISVGPEQTAVGPGSVIFVAAGVDHRFHHIEEDLAVIVVFGPPEGSRS